MLFLRTKKFQKGISNIMYIEIKKNLKKYVFNLALILKKLFLINNIYTQFYPA